MVSLKAIDGGRTAKDYLEAMTAAGPGHIRADAGCMLAEDALGAMAAG